MILPVFVYGTLKSNIPVGYHGLDNFGWSILPRKEAKLNGNLHIIPSVNATFPAVGELNTGNFIVGELVYINDPIFLEMLDRIESEGVMYNRVIATTTDGEKCFVYQWHEPSQLEYLIAHGNFQYTALRAQEDEYLGIPLQAMEGETFRVFIPKIMTICEVPVPKETGLPAEEVDRSDGSGIMS